MDIKEIKELMDAACKTPYGFINIKHEGTELTLSSEPVNMGQPATTNDSKNVKEPISVSHSLKESIQKTDEVTTDTKVDQVSDEDCYIVNSPLVGTFYTAPAPDAEDFVKVGDRVKVGDTLCIIEAMKLMNEIESEVSGEIVAICANNEAGVEYSQPLFKIKQG